MPKKKKKIGGLRKKIAKKIRRMTRSMDSGEGSKKKTKTYGYQGRVKSMPGRGTKKTGGVSKSVRGRSFGTATRGSKKSGGRRRR